MSQDQLFQFLLFRSRRAPEQFLNANQRFMVRYQAQGAGPSQLFHLQEEESRFEYLAISTWETKDFFQVFRNGMMPMGSARIEQAGGYYLVDEKGDAGLAQPGEQRFFLFFPQPLTAEMMQPLMEEVPRWRIYKEAAKSNVFKFIWEGILDGPISAMEGLPTSDRGLYSMVGTYASDPVAP